MNNLWSTIITFVVLIIIVIGSGLLMGMTIGGIFHMFLSFIMIGALLTFPMILMRLVELFGNKDLADAEAKASGVRMTTQMFSAKEEMEKLKRESNGTIDRSKNDVYVMNDEDYSVI